MAPDYNKMNSISCLHSTVSLNTKQATTEVCSAVNTSATQVPILHKTESHKKIFHHDIKGKFPTRTLRPRWEQRV